MNIKTRTYHSIALKIDDRYTPALHAGAMLFNGQQPRELYIYDSEISSKGYGSFMSALNEISSCYINIDIIITFSELANILTLGLEYLVKNENKQESK